ncbi:MAG: hypothetical protein AAGE52_15950 [Myxococcota bacterium]
MRDLFRRCLSLLLLVLGACEGTMMSVPPTPDARSVSDAALGDAGLLDDAGDLRDAGSRDSSLGDSDGGAAADAGPSVTDAGTDGGDSSGPALRPGDGFDGEIRVPDHVGDRSAPSGDRIAMARWDVVPEQTFPAEFPIGVVAHHAYGIDYVEFQVEGGVAVQVSRPSVNPRTGVEEYWVTLSASDFADQRLEVRAVAYPNDGIPRILPSLFLFANAGGSIRHPVLELPAGRHEIAGRDIPSEGWLTIRPEAGVAKDDCIIIGRSQWREGNVRFQGLTVQSNGQALALGSFNADKERDMVWYDDVSIRGTEDTPWLTQAWSHHFFTDVDVTTTFETFKHGPVLLRNVTADDLFSDFANANGLYVNVEVSNMHRRHRTGAHPDLFQFPAGIPNNLIIQDLVADDNIDGQGFFADRLEDVAIVRLQTRSVSPFQSLHLMAAAENLLIEDSSFNNGRFRADVRFTADDVVLRDVFVTDLAPLHLPNGWDLPGVTVLPTP